MERKEPRLYKRNRIYWVKYYVSTGQGDRLVRHSLGTEDEVEAEKKFVEIRYKRNEGTIRAPSRSFLSELACDYESFLKKRLAAKSWLNDVSYLRQFVAWLQDHRFNRLESVTAAVILRFLTERSDERSWKPKTWNRALGAIRGIFKYALKYQDFVSADPRHENPAAAVDQLKVLKPVIRYLDRDQIREQLDALQPHPEMQAIVAMLIFAGLRREELTWLRREDVDLVAGNIRITSKEVGGVLWTAKTNKDRRVPISSDLRRFLEKWESTCRRRNGAWASGQDRDAEAEPTWYFPSPEMCRWNPDNLSHALEKLQRKNGQGFPNTEGWSSWTCLHFRHTFATQLAARGVTLDRIAKLMGNSVLICERHYAAFVTERMGDIVELGIYCQPQTASRDDGAGCNRLVASH